jgi:hypothetical protein
VIEIDCNTEQMDGWYYGNFSDLASLVLKAEREERGESIPVTIIC